MTMTPQHSDTEARPSRLDLRIQQGLEWIAEHRRGFLIGLAALVVLGGAAAIGSEVASSRRDKALAAFAAIDADFAAKMGAQPDVVLIPEPANPDQARSAREAALAAFEAFAAEHSGSDLASNALLRSAELEVDLGRLDAAAARLEGLVASLDADDPRKALALRLRGFVLEDLGRAAEAADAYEAGGALESYPARALLWIAAARTHMRLGADERALNALDQAVAAEPEFATDPNIERERRVLQARLALAAASPAKPPEPGAPSGSPAQP